MNIITTKKPPNLTTPLSRPVSTPIQLLPTDPTVIQFASINSSQNETLSNLGSAVRKLTDLVLK